MDFDSPDVEKDFPGLYASESADGKSRKSKEESDYSEGDHDKLSKKDLLIGRRKEKKEKGKDRGYAALEGESSPEEELDAKNPSKSKKSKAFKFTSSKSKDKREKSREKDKNDKDPKEEEKVSRIKDKPDKEKDFKKKEKEQKKKDKKTKQSSCVSEEVLELGDVQPVFGVSISLATERSHCHDGVDLPLVVRDCIDYLQEYALKNEQIYKIEPLKTRLLQYKRLYNNRERQAETDELNIATACGLLKLFMRELPEPILTTDLITRFEEVASHPQVTKQQNELEQLLEQLPRCNKTLLSWILLHFDAVIQNEKYNKLNAQSLAMLLSPPLQMSHRLLIALLCHCPILFSGVKLLKYVPPLTSSSPKLPESPDDIQTELRKQESLLAQIHAEMNTGFASKKREEQLWEVQRIITQLKRKLRSFEKKVEKSNEDSSQTTTKKLVYSSDTIDAKSMHTKQTKSIGSDEESSKLSAALSSTDSANWTASNNLPKESHLPSNTSEGHLKDIIEGKHPEGLYIDEDTGFVMVPKTHPDYVQLLRLQLENQELLAWKTQLQTRINAERAETLQLKQLYQQQIIKKSTSNTQTDEPSTTGDTNGVDYEKIIENYIRENSLLEHKKQILAKELFDEHRECIALQVELALQQF